MKKRIIGLFLVFCIILTIVPTPILAVSIVPDTRVTSNSKWMVSKETVYDSESILSQTEYKYNDIGRVVKKVEKRYWDGSLHETNSAEYIYDDSNHSLTIKYSLGSYDEWECDEEMRPVKGECHATGEVGYCTKKYDSQGYLIEEYKEWKGEGGEGSHYTIQYSYDLNGILTREDTIVDTPYGALPMNRTEYQIESVDQNGNVSRFRFDDTELGVGYLEVEYVYIPPQSDEGEPTQSGDGIPTFHAMVLNGIGGDDEAGSDNDAALMYTSLCKNQMSEFVSIADNIHTISYNCDNNPVSEETVNKWIDWSFSNTDDDDVSLFYYSGHSTWDGVSAKEYGITLGASSYRWAKLAKYLADHVDGQIIVILDACFANNFTTIGVQSLDKTDQNRISVLVSCSENEESGTRNAAIFKGIHKLYYGIFTYYIGSGIGFFDDNWRSDVNGDGKVTLLELYNYTSKNVAEYCRKNDKVDSMSVQMVTKNDDIVLFQHQIKKVDFADVDEKAYYWDAVKWAINRGITNGTSDTTFSPSQPCTRAQVVTFLWRANGSPKMTGSNPFKDVTTSAYYYDAVQWASQNGITAGTSATTFSPNQACTRAQVVTFLWRAHGQPVFNMKNPFLDVKKGQFYYDAVLWAVSNDVTKGTSQTLFSPDLTCTRGQIVTFLYRDLG